MGGFGSGRKPSWRQDTVEQCRSLDVNRLNRAGCLIPGWSGGLQWSVNVDQTGNIKLKAEAGRMLLSYRIRIDGGDWEDVEESVPFVHLPCRFGGRRSYFLCPGIVDGAYCGRRVVKLYITDKYFLCRHCTHLKYESQSEGVLYRAMRRTDKIRVRLGGKAGIANPFPGRPKGMWRSTYDRLQNKSYQAEVKALMEMDAALDKMTGHRENHKKRKDFW